MTEAAAAASIFRLSFLPMRGQTVNRNETTKHAEKVGPLCGDCIEAVRDLAATDEEAIAPNEHTDVLANADDDL